MCAEDIARAFLRKSWTQTFKHARRKLAGKQSPSVIKKIKRAGAEAAA
jgi:hypothetical protein